MRGGGFTFKQFHIDHSRCAMKVGTDGTLLGAWATLPPEAHRILDIGTGSGLIAIMAAQRHPSAKIMAIDIDEDCVLQARQNATSSPWAERIEVINSPLQGFQSEVKFDVIISNPPYFADSMHSPDKQRTTARHTASLSFKDLAEGVLRLCGQHQRVAQDALCWSYTKSLRKILPRARKSLSKREDDTFIAKNTRL